jgi:hypothetical protein
LGISLILGPKISHTLLGIIKNRSVPTGADFLFFCEHPISSFWSRTGLKSRKIKLFRRIFLHYIQYITTTLANFAFMANKITKYETGAEHT